MAKEHETPMNAALLTDALQGALSRAYGSPAAPSELRAQVMAAIARERAVDALARREGLEREYRAAIGQLNRRYLQRCRDALIVGLGIVVLMGLAVRPLAESLTPVFAGAAPIIAGFGTLGMGVVCGALLMRDFFWQRGVNRF